MLCCICTTLYSSWPAANSYCLHHNVGNSLLPLTIFGRESCLKLCILTNKARTMRYSNFWCITFISSKFFKHVQKTLKSWETICSITIFHQKPEKKKKTLLQAWKTPQNNCLFSSRLFFREYHGQKSWDTLAFLGGFQFTEVQPLHSQTMLDAWIQNFFLSFNFIG